MKQAYSPYVYHKEEQPDGFIPKWERILRNPPGFAAVPEDRQKRSMASLSLFTKKINRYFEEWKADTDTVLPAGERHEAAQEEREYSGTADVRIRYIPREKPRTWDMDLDALCVRLGQPIIPVQPGPLDPKAWEELEWGGNMGAI